MKTALIFPGQGSQYIKMGLEFYESYSESKEIYNQLDHTLERDLTNLIFYGNESELSETQNSQPAIMATSTAIFRALVSENLLPEGSFQAVAGHSLGEYSALVANGGIGFNDSVRLLKIRSKAMQDSMPVGTGGMIALIGCERDIIDNAIKSASQDGKIYLANDNADGQIVLSGEINAIEYILQNAKSLNIRRAIKLPVSAPFHCELMGHAAQVLQVEINKINFNKFNADLYSNVTSMKCTENEIAQLLIDQVVSVVKWREIIQNMIQDGYSKFIEIGPGNVLTNLVKRMSKNIHAFSISKIEDLKKLEI
tara:strand:- start:259 stop:1188 length:930 start_codon:yes stop_codon:yes gene_type:complete